ncbi:histidine decarboxylase [Chitinophaga dinghuensis]|uniref:Histidine decarboxylase n=1 Tax=Chitinophaga dinghuensis TaxID=1539050 RepID=A0A327VVU2_9BACT|nr:histidine decarboxylase [Chitinophaga dinghuensis]RAJ79340.1 histidine decarboxylase [Chitinophaga dinghuensis]
MNTSSILPPADKSKLEALLASVGAGTANFLGYPVAKEFDYSALMPFLQYPLNNLGDPFIPSTYSVGTRELEKEVVEFFARLFRAPASDWWGYVTNGGSEGNLYALYLARELYPKGMVYYSGATHYSVQKNLHLLNMPSIVIRTQENGEMDYDDLENMISMHRHLPAIVLANIGTTMTEARDDVKRIKHILNRMAIRQHYIHADGALSGSYSAFLEDRPAFDFADGANSIAISGHKFIGSPIPCGVVVAQKSYRDRIARSVAYIGTLDTTITGSRNGHSPLFLWYAVKSMGMEGLAARAHQALEIAAYAEEQLQAIGIPAWRNKDTLTVVFPEPEEHIRRKWQLASENGWSHIICMPGVTRALIDSFIAEMAAAAVLVG